MHTDPQQQPPQQQLTCGSLAQPAVTVSNAGTILQSLADIAPAQAPPPQTAPGGPGGPGDVSVNSSVCSPASVGHGGQDSRGSPPQQQQHGLQDLGLRLEDPPSDDHEEIDDEQMMDGSPLLDDDDDEDSECGDRVIYPWMKKIHVAGVGE